MRMKSMVAGSLLAVALWVVPAAAGESAVLVSEESARQTALGQLEGARVIRSKTRTRHDGRVRYTYLLINDKSRAEVAVDGETGSVVKLDLEPIETEDFDGRVRGGWKTRLSAADAREAALKRVGGGEVVKVEKDYDDDGPAVYEVDIIKDDMKYEVEIDADTGDVREYKAKKMDGKKRGKSERRRNRDRDRDRDRDRWDD